LREEKMNKKIVLLIVVLFVSMVFLSGCSETNESDILEGLEYKNYEYGFGFNPPTGWTKDTSGIFGTIIFFYAPVDDDFAENINVVSDVLPSGTSLSSYVDINRDYLNDFFANYSLIISNSRIINGMNAIGDIYTYNQGIFDLKVNQVIVEKNSKLIILTYSAEIEDYDTYSFEFEQCANSLIIV
jgi:hypothetical protein